MHIVTLFLFTKFQGALINAKLMYMKCYSFMHKKHIFGYTYYTYYKYCMPSLKLASNR